MLFAFDLLMNSTLFHMRHFPATNNQLKAIDPVFEGGMKECKYG